jgi:hypothetical protein
LCVAGRPTVRRAELPGGNRMTEKRTPVAERRQETATGWPAPSGWWPRITGRIRAFVARPGRALTRSGEPVKRKTAMTPEPKDKLDATTARLAW